MGALRPVTPPRGSWLPWLRRDDYVWLVKEEMPALVCFPWLPDRPGHAAGQLVLRKRMGDQLGPVEIWYVTGAGCGFDHHRLMQPCEGYLGGVVDETAMWNGQHITSDILRVLEECRARLAHIEQHLPVNVPRTRTIDLDSGEPL